MLLNSQTCQLTAGRDIFKVDAQEKTNKSHYHRARKERRGNV